MNRRERQLLERKQDILDAALRLFERNGYLQTSMEEIAEAADVARGTLYNHFASKGEVVLALTRAVADEWIRAGAEKLERGGSPTAAIRTLVITTAEWFDAHPDSASIFYHAVREMMAKEDHESPPPALLPREWVIAAQDQGELTRELPPDLIVQIIDSVLRNSMITLAREKSKGNRKLVPMVKKHTDVIMRRLSV